MDEKYRRTPADVAADASIEHTGKGVFNQLKGAAKEVWGRLSNKPGTKLEGKLDQAKGRVQQGLGRMEAKESRLESGGIRRDERDIDTRKRGGNV